MAITASTSGYDAIVKSGPGSSIFENGKAACDTSSTWFQGDLLMFNTSSNALRVVSATGDALTFVGIADNTVSGGKLVGPYTGLTAVDAAAGSAGFAGPKKGVVARLVIKTSDSLAVGAKVYLVNGGTSQQVTSSDPGDGNYIGINNGPAVTTAAAGTKVDILLGSRYPSATGTGLSF